MLPLVLVLLGALGALGRVCQNPVPGLDKQSRGVDITSLDLTPVNTLSSDDGFKGPIVTYTCDQQKHKIIDGVTYDVPDQVWIISDINSGTLTTSVDVQKTYHEARDTMSTNAGIGGAFRLFSFSASGSFSRTQTDLVKHDKTVETAYASFGVRRVDLQPSDHLPLGTVAQDRLTHLPATYTSNPTAYENFIKQFGTHYITQATFGGLMLQYMETGSDYTESHDERTLEVQASASFGGLISAHGGHSSSHTSVDTAFRQATTTTVRYYGGNANLLSSNGIAQWQPTISAHPWLYSTQLAPISDLVHDASKKHALDVAVNDYVLRRYLTVELPRLLHTLPSVTLSQTSARTLQSKIDTMAHKRPLVESEVAALGREVEQGYKDILLNYYLNDDNYHQVNNFGQPFTYECPAGKIITHLGGDFHDNDRAWKVGCNYAPGVGALTNCVWSDYIPIVNSITYSCPHNGVIKGISKTHQNNVPNWSYRFKCCDVTNAVTVSCAFTGYVNTLGHTFDFKINNRQEVLKGFSSYFDKPSSPFALIKAILGDRQFKFQKCGLHYYN